MKRDSKWFAAKKGRRDANHAVIAKALHGLGHTVIDTAGVGDDVPDLCVYPRLVEPRAHLEYPRTHDPVPTWLEVKTEDGEPTAGQLAWAAEAKRRGIRHAFVLTLDEALEALR